MGAIQESGPRRVRDAATAVDLVERADAGPASHRVGPWVPIVAIAAVTIVSRLPQLAGPNLLLDGDEAILGLMAKHVAHGRAFPIFFYGQHYGFAPVEETLGALAFLLFGTSAVALKTASLLLWTSGVVFLYLAASRHMGPARSFWVVLLLVLNPAWAVPSIRSWIGYDTAFTSTAVLLWLLSRDPGRETILRWLGVGLLIAVIYLAQPLWLAGAAPIVLVALVSRRKVSWALVCISVAGAAIFLVKLVPPNTPTPWIGPPVGNHHLLESLPLVARQLYVSLTGSYYLWWAIDPPGIATRALAALWCAVIPVLVVVQIHRVATRRYSRASHLLFLAVGSTILGEWLLLGARDARYFLPLSPLVVLLAGVELVDLIDRRAIPRGAARAVVVVALALGTGSMLEFARFNFLWSNARPHMSEADRLRLVISDLEVHGVRGVFSMNGMLDPDIVFYSDERVVARSTYPVSRYPPYAREVDRALAAGEPVAVVGYTDTSGAPGCEDVPICTGDIARLVPNPENIFTVDGKYFVYVGADRALLERLHFRFWD